MPELEWRNLVVVIAVYVATVVLTRVVGVEGRWSFALASVALAVTMVIVARRHHRDR